PSVSSSWPSGGSTWRSVASSAGTDRWDGRSDRKSLVQPRRLIVSRAYKPTGKDARSRHPMVRRLHERSESRWSRRGVTKVSARRARYGRNSGARHEPGEGAVKKKDSGGFASMDRDKQREIASKGGKAAHAKGTAHEWSREQARDAGRKGGLARAQSRRTIEPATVPEI